MDVSVISLNKAETQFLKGARMYLISQLPLASFSSGSSQVAAQLPQKLPLSLNPLGSPNSWDKDAQTPDLAPLLTSC